MYSASRPNICEHQHLLFEHCRDVAICSSSSFKNRKVDESDFRQCKKYKRWQCLSHRVWVPSEAHVRKVAPPRICTHPYDIWGRCCTPLKRKRQHHDASCQKKSSHKRLLVAVFRHSMETLAWTTARAVHAELPVVFHIFHWMLFHLLQLMNVHTHTHLDARLICNSWQKTSMDRQQMNVWTGQL